MTDLRKNTTDILIRNISNDKKEKLKILARKNKFDSVTAYLQFIIEQLTSEEEVIKTEIRFQELLNQQTELLKLNIQIIEKNNQLFERMLDEMV